MKTIWVTGAIAVGILDYWCHRTHRPTLSQVVVATVPEWLLYLLIAILCLHLRNMYHRLT